jgi:ADP-heptose:LPS heptosyltransferase
MPDVTITVGALDTRNAEYLSMSPDIDEVITFSSIRNVYRDSGKLLALCLRNTDMLIVPYLSENNYARFISRIAGKTTVGYDQKGNSYDVTIPLEHKHELEINLDIVRTLFPKSANKLLRDLTPFVQWPKCPSGELKVGFHTSAHSSMPGKCWPYPNFAALGRLLKQNSDAATYLFGGKSDNLNGVKSGDFDLNLVGKSDLKETMEKISEMDIFVTNDSGLMHIAASLQVPVVSIFGPTDECKNAPVGRKHLVIKQELECRPCYEPWGRIKCIQNVNYKCLNDISPETVFLKMQESGFLT